LILYHVTAYRWGNLNLHQYRVYCGPDKTKAIALAQSECDDRGGKYGCAVYQWNEDGTEYTRIAYFGGSMHNEPAPFHNWRVDFFERLGHLLYEWSGGKIWLPDPENPAGPLKLTEVSPPPQCVIDEIARREKFADHMLELTWKRLNRGDGDG
jgi:hypothetical protein